MTESGGESMSKESKAITPVILNKEGKFVSTKPETISRRTGHVDYVKNAEGRLPSYRLRPSYMHKVDPEGNPPPKTQPSKDEIIEGEITGEEFLANKKKEPEVVTAKQSASTAGRKPEEPKREVHNKKPESSEKTFKSSWLVENEDEFKDLRAGKLGTIGKKIAMFHETGIVNVVSEKDLSERVVKWGEEAIEEGQDEDGEEIWVKTAPYLSRMTRKVQDLNETEEKPGGNGEEVEGLRHQMQQQQEEYRREIDVLKNGLIVKNQELMAQFNEGFISLQDVLQGSALATLRLTELYGKGSSWDERKRWVDDEYQRAFYTRFQPNMEPKFYTEIVARHPEQKSIWDSRWQLARAAYFKLATSAKPEEYQNNKDLEMLSEEHLERLHNIPGVRPMMEAYARQMTRYMYDDIGPSIQVSLHTKLSEPIKIAGEKEREIISIYDCQKMGEFEDFRRQLRSEVLRNNTDLAVAARQLKVELDGQGYTDVTFDEVLGLMEKEADAIAFNLLYVSNQFESSNSYYSHKGDTVFSIPGAVESDDFRRAMHQSEGFFGKSLLRQEWGVFTPWGIAQIERIESEIRTKAAVEIRAKIMEESSSSEARKKDEIEKLQELIGSKRLQELMNVKYKPGPVGSYWNYKVGKLPQRKEGEIEVEKGEMVVQVPECYPVTACGSFFEETRLKGRDSMGRLVETTVLQHLLEGNEIEWKTAGFEDITAAWLWSKFRRAAVLQEEFFHSKPEEPSALQNPMTARKWVNKAKEVIFTRLGMAKKLDDIKDVFSKRNKGIEDEDKLYQTYQDIHNLKVWAVYAEYGGMKNPTVSQPIPNIDARERFIVTRFLKSGEARYLAPNEDLNIH